MSDPGTFSYSSSTSFIDDDYNDQMEISGNFSPQAEQEYIYPSAASFPDHDIMIPIRHRPRHRLMSCSEPDLSQQSCHQFLQHRWNRWTSALRTWSTPDVLSAVDCEEEEGEDKGAATPI